MVIHFFKTFNLYKTLNYKKFYWVCLGIILPFSYLYSSSNETPSVSSDSSLQIIETKETSSKTVPIFAVGEAQLVRDRLSFPDPLLSSELTSKHIKEVKEFHDIFVNDFSFYKNIFDIRIGGTTSEAMFRKSIIESTTDSDKKNLLQYKVEIYAHEINVKKPSSSFQVEISAFNIKENKEIFYLKKEISEDTLRNFAHECTDKIYQLIVGRGSIFLSKIVFVSDNFSRGKKRTKELFLMDFDGKSLQQITHHNSLVISPAMSYDKKKIVYSLIDYKKKIRNVDLYIYDLETKTSKVISSLPGINSGAVFLPGDEEIALTLTLKGNADIYVMNLKTKSLRALTTSSAEDVDPSFSRDGKKFSFLSDRSGKAMVYTASGKVAEKDVKRVSYVGLLNATPRLSPDGDEMVFASWVDNSFDIYRLSSDSNKLDRLTKKFGSNEDPSFSPDGQFILFSSQRILSSVKSVQNLYIMTRDGEIIGAAISDFGNCTSPRWSN